MSKLTVQFPTKTTKALAILAESDETSKTEILKRAITLYRYLMNELKEDEGKKLVITDKNGKNIKEIVIT